MVLHFYDDSQIVIKIENEWASLDLVPRIEIHKTEEFSAEAYNYRDTADENSFKNLVNLTLRKGI